MKLHSVRPGYLKNLQWSTPIKAAQKRENKRGTTNQPTITRYSGIQAQRLSWPPHQNNVGPFRHDNSAGRSQRVIQAQRLSWPPHQNNVGPFRHDNSAGRSQRVKGFSFQKNQAQYGVPDLELGESKEFPPLKIFTAKTVGKYIAINKNIAVEDVEDEPVVAKQAKKTPVKKVASKKKPAPAIDEPAVKRKRTLVGRTAPVATDLALVRVAQEAVPIQIISVVTPPAPKRKAPKRRLKLPAGSDDEIVQKEPDVVDVGEQQWEKTTADEVDKIIEMVLTETEHMETDMGKSDVVTECTDRDIVIVLAGNKRSTDEDDNLDGAGNEISRKMAYFTTPKQFLKEPLRSGENDDMSGSKQPSISTASAAAEETNIEDLSLAKNVATMTDSEDTGPLSKALELTDSTKSDEESIQEGNDLWKHLPKRTVSLELELPPQRQFDDTLALVIEFFRVLHKCWADVCIEVVQFSTSGSLQPVGSHNFCRDIVAVGSVVDVEVDPAAFVGVFRRDPTASTSPSQLRPDIALTSTSASTDSRMFFTTDDTPLGVDQILMPAAVTPLDFTEPLAQLRALVNQIPTERVQKRDDSEKLKDVLLLHIKSLEQRVTEMLDQQDKTYRAKATQILMPAAVTPLDFTEPLAQLRALVNQIPTERVQKRDDSEKLKDVLLLHIKSLEQRVTEMLDQQDKTYRGLFGHIRHEVQLQKAALSLDILASQQKLQSQQVALSQTYDDQFKRIQDRKYALSHELMEFRVQEQEKYNHLMSQLSELVDLSIEGVMTKRGKVIAAGVQVRILLLLIVVDRVLAAEIVGAVLQVEDTT
ncbi:splicing factor 3B subunit 1-like [Dorcoceras hygrometricum]|uniref:Splicing factor 3B subunit 1-like n=1 Tax=Dorcoceras hygrometricum TaxID=472368 RepID=A0A2Z7CRL8_9LAMI|nr:splicing factor 3B subunit 1-like [Dorcoceras hygrometricum]